MKNEIKLNSSEWCDVVFDGKNKEYGAYDLRQSSSKRHALAFLSVLAFIAVAALLPTLLSWGQNNSQPTTDGIEGIYKVTDIDNTKIDDPIAEAIKKVEEVKTPDFMTSERFVVPTITDKPIDKNDEMRSQSDVLASNDRISSVDFIGTNKDAGLDAGTLKFHGDVVQIDEIEKKRFIKVEQMPMFPGGKAEMYAFISKNLVYPIMALEANIQGTVNLRFVITPEGDVSEVEVIKGVHPSCDREAVRVVKLMPKWTPGRQQSRAVYVYYSLPISFRIG